MSDKVVIYEFIGKSGRVWKLFQDDYGNIYANVGGLPPQLEKKKSFYVNNDRLEELARLSERVKVLEEALAAIRKAGE